MFRRLNLKPFAKLIEQPPFVAFTKLLDGRVGRGLDRGDVRLRDDANLAELVFEHIFAGAGENAKIGDFATDKLADALDVRALRRGRGGSRGVGIRLRLENRLEVRRLASQRDRTVEFDEDASRNRRRRFIALDGRLRRRFRRVDFGRIRRIVGRLRAFRRDDGSRRLVVDRGGKRGERERREKRRRQRRHAKKERVLHRILSIREGATSGVPNKRRV